jgi:tetratricopeptide (TPR) repeat protein
MPGTIAESRLIMTDFFVSYTGADQKWAEWIAWQLKSAGYGVTVQAWDFLPGCNFIVEMHKAAEDSDRTLAVLSPAYLAAAYTMPELAAAFADDPNGEERKLVPIRVEDFEPTGLFKSIVYIDLVGKEEDEAVEALLAGLGPGPAESRSKPSFPRGQYEGEAFPPTAPRFPAALPPIWNVPHLRNPNFTGRESLLAEVHSSLESGHPLAITGLGGVGKSQVVIEYAYRYFPEYEAVAWIRAEDPAILSSDFAALARLFKIAVRERAEQAEVVNAVRKWLDHNPGWLLVFDNAQEPNQLSNFIPQAATGHVVITSRNPNWAAVAHTVDVSVLNRSESVSLLLKRSCRDDQTAAGDLAEELGDLPLALAQAGAFVHEAGITLADYLQLFRTRRAELWNSEHQPLGYTHTVGTTWKLAMSRIEAESPDGAALLELMSYLAPDRIPQDLLGSGANLLPQGLSEVVGDALRLTTGLGLLRRFSLVEVHRGEISMHRLVQAVTRDSHDDASARKWARAALQLVEGSFPTECDDTGTWPICEALIGHATAVTERADALNLDRRKLAKLLRLLGVYLRCRARYLDSLMVSERALDVAAREYGPDNIRTAKALSNLGIVLCKLGECSKDLGFFEHARRVFGRVVAIDEQEFGPRHREVGIDLGNLSIALKSLGLIDEARKSYERALDIGRETLGEEHPDLASRINNYALLLVEQGELEEARDHLERAVKISEQAKGPDNLKVAAYRCNLGVVLSRLGDIETGMKMCEDARSVALEKLGPDHPEIASFLTDLAEVLERHGDEEGASRNREIARGIIEEAYGPEDLELGDRVTRILGWLDQLGDRSVDQ